MKIDILFPFIDFRNLYNNQFVCDRPQWPGISNDFLRCCGMLKPNGVGYSYVHNGVKLSETNIHGLKKIKRKIEFPFWNNILGLYSLSFFLKKDALLDYMPNDIIDYFNKDIKFNIKNLVNSSCQNDIVGIKKLSKELRLQYYWATRKLVNSNNEKLYDIPQESEIYIDTINEELKEIKFLSPVFFIDTVGYKYEFKEHAIYRSNVFKGKMARIEKNGFDIFHLKRKNHMLASNFKEVCNFIYAFERNWIFYKYMFELFSQLKKCNKVDKDCMGKMA